MPGTVLDGKALVQQIETELSVRFHKIKEKSNGKTPILATILVGDDPASATYVRMKGNACKRVGMESLRIVLPQATTTEELLNEIDKLNANPDVHGILLQHPVPKQVDERCCFDRISVSKDVDGVTALGFGRMAMGEPAFGSATPAGIMRLLRHYGIPVEGKHAVVVGRSPIRGKLDPKWSEWFAGFSITHTNGETVLEGTVADQSALYGILAKIHDLGLTLIRVERLSKESNLSQGVLP